MLTLPEHDVYAVKVDTDVVIFGDGVHTNMSPDVGTHVAVLVNLQV